MRTNELIIVALAWIAIGLFTAFVMRRRGHDFYVWLMLGTVLGPLVLPLAIERVRFHETRDRRSALLPAPPARGFDLVAGIDGSEESMEAVRSALRLFGGSLTSLTIATVLDYDSESALAGHEQREQARQLLEEVASSADVDFVRTEIVYGRPDQALTELARTTGAELIVVGARGRGATEALFGSVTSRLVGACEVPVFVGPCGGPGRHGGSPELGPGALASQTFGG